MCIRDRVDGVPNSCNPSSGDCNVGVSRVEWNGALAANQTVTITFRVRIRQNVPDDTRICFDTQVNFDSDGNGTNDNSAHSNASVSYTHLTLPTSDLCRSRWSPYH